MSQKTKVIETGQYVVLRSRVGIKESLYLDYTVANKRIRENLNLYLWVKPNIAQKEQNKSILTKAKLLRFEKEATFLNIIVETTKEPFEPIDFLKFFEEYIRLYKNKDKRIILACYKRFKAFINKDYLLTSELTEGFLIEFKTHLLEKLTGETPFNYFKKLKKVIKKLRKSNLIETNPIEDIKIKRPELRLKKETLTVSDIQSLYNTPCANSDLKRAFLFCCNTGLRWCDVSVLKWYNIKENLIIFDQVKTNGGVIGTINENASYFLGLRGLTNDLVFKRLPTSLNGANKTLKAWVRRAKINKHITWHCARHTVGVLLDSAGVPIQNIADVLGHNDLRQAMIYRRYNQERANQAVNTIPKIIIET